MRSKARCLLDKAVDAMVAAIDGINFSTPSFIPGIAKTSESSS